jgi:predicted RNase H-like nuclease (RuvC/YqgF family)
VEEKARKKPMNQIELIKELHAEILRLTIENEHLKAEVERLKAENELLIK